MENAELVTQFCSIVNCAEDRAKFFLGAAAWNLEVCQNYLWILIQQKYQCWCCQQVCRSWAILDPDFWKIIHAIQVGSRYYRRVIFDALTLELLQAAIDAFYANPEDADMPDVEAVSQPASQPASEPARQPPTLQEIASKGAAPPKQNRF